MAELLEYLARQLVDEPDAVRVERVEEDDTVVLRLHVAQEDLGKVIGRQGRIARALRTIVRAGGTRDRRRVPSSPVHGLRRRSSACGRSRTACLSSVVTPIAK